MQFTFVENDYDTFLRHDLFKQRVRNIVQDEVFLQNLRNRVLDEYRIGEMAEKRVDRVIGGKVADELIKRVPSMLRDYLHNDVRMQTIMRNHADEVNRTVENGAKRAMDKILSDPRYHEINTRYFKAFERKGEVAIRNWNTSANKRVDEMLRQTRDLHSRMENMERNMQWRINLSIGLSTAALGLAGIVAGYTGMLF